MQAAPVDNFGNPHSLYLRLTRKVVLFFVIGSAVGFCSAGEAENSTKRIFQAGEMAYEKFAQVIAKSPNRSELEKFFGRIDNYEINLREETDFFIVTFSPKLYKGQTLRGGGASYKISKSDLSVTESIMHK